MEDKDVIASFWKENCEYFGYDVSYELCQRFAETWINSKTFYVWKNNNKIVSFLGYDAIDNTAEISHAYTDPNERGKGYMPYLIYEVTKIILSKGLLPVLNTDYSYESSNNAYKKVGFKEKELMYSFSTTLHKNKKWTNIKNSTFKIKKATLKGKNYLVCLNYYHVAVDASINSVVENKPANPHK